MKINKKYINLIINEELDNINSPKFWREIIRLVNLHGNFINIEKYYNKICHDPSNLIYSKYLVKTTVGQAIKNKIFYNEDVSMFDEIKQNVSKIVGKFLIRF